MQVTYRKNLGGSYMCVEEEEKITKGYELHMLERHSIPGLLRLQTSVLEGKRRYLYDISGKQQIADYLSGRKIGYQLLQTLLFSIQKVCASVTEYLLREDGICLEMEFIYVNLEDGSLQFTYLPFYQKNLPKAFVECMEQLLRQIDHQDQAATELGYQVYQLCIQDNANIRNILETSISNRKVLTQEHERHSKDSQTGPKKNQSKNQQQEIQFQAERIENKKETVDKRRQIYEKFCSWSIENRGNSTDKKIDKQRKKECLSTNFLESKIFVWKKIIQNMIQKEGYKKDKAKAGKTSKDKSGKWFSIKSFHQRQKSSYNKKKDVQEPKQITNQEKGEYQQSLEDNENLLRPTEILSMPADKPLGRLIYQGIHQYENFTVQEEVFLIGKNGAQVNGVIPSEGVSRLHAKVYCREGEFYIEDLNSTNGTYLNDTALEYHQPRQLSRGDRVRFGAEEYLFS